MNRELSLANAIAHGEQIGYQMFFRCENCGNTLFTVIHTEEMKSRNDQVIIIKRIYYLKCTECGSEEVDRILTIIPDLAATNIKTEGIIQ